VTITNRELFDFITSLNLNDDDGLDEEIERLLSMMFILDCVC
jgi:hypothetical protein